jgi:hypothetical protein
MQAPVGAGRRLGGIPSQTGRHAAKLALDCLAELPHKTGGDRVE